LILEKPFDQFVSELQPNSSEEHEIVKQAKKPDIAIRMEYMVEDLHKLPFIDFNDPTVQFIIDSWIKRNAYTSEGCMENHRPEFDLRRNEVNPAMTDFLSYYTQKELDIVWDLYKDVFNEFGYQREYV
jgi:hypothetical protein